MIKRLFLILRRLLGTMLRPVLYAGLGGFIAVVAFALVYLNNRPETSIWHETILSEEYSIASEINDFDSYLKLEDRLFDELDREIYSKINEAEKTEFNRFNKGSLSDPSTRSPNWNRTFEHAAQDPTSGVLLLHGLSDSPYSLRSLGQQMHDDGAHVIGLRIPGHGTAPSGLRLTTFEDMAGAVALTMRHLKATVGDKPIYIVGYSNGGALAIHYTDASLNDASLPAVAGLILLSPEVGISPAAAFAPALAWVGETFRIKKLAWNSIQVEFDPYKYNSFPLNAGVLAYHATQLIRTQLEGLTDNGRIAEMPPILAFQSAADATVEASVLIKELFGRLEAGNHELVIFDVNRVYEAQGLLVKPSHVERLLEGQPRRYKVSVVTNKSPRSLAAILQERTAGSQETETHEIEPSWSLDIYSLAHIALPFAPDDPLYGSGEQPPDRDPENVDTQTLRLGSIAVHGERNTLSIPISALTRQHWNPFYSVVTDKVRAFTRENGQEAN